MNLTTYSVFSAMLWFSVFAVVLMILRRRDSFVLRFGLLPLICLIVTTVLRLLVPIEFPFTRVVGSTTILRAFFGFIQKQLFILDTWEIQVWHIMLIIWFTVTGIWLAGLVLENIRFRKRVTAYPDTVSPVVDSFLENAHGFGRIRVVSSPEIGSPYIGGFINPIIVLTQNNFSDEDLHLVLLHEWQHYLNKDQWIKAVYKIVRGFLWWNPVVHLFEEQLDRTLEMRCDSCVLSKLSEDQREDYYSMLVRAHKEKKAYEQMRVTLSVPALITFSPKSIFGKKAKKSDRDERQRLLFIFHYTELIKKNKALKTLFCCIVTTMFLASYMVVFQPRDYGPAQEDGYTYVTEFTGDVYLVEEENGRYGLYMNNEYTGTVDDITVEPFCSFPIQK